MKDKIELTYKPNLISESSNEIESTPELPNDEDLFLQQLKANKIYIDQQNTINNMISSNTVDSTLSVENMGESTIEDPVA